MKRKLSKKTYATFVVSILFVVFAVAFLIYQYETSDSTKLKRYIKQLQYSTMEYSTVHVEKDSVYISFTLLSNDEASLKDAFAVRHLVEEYILNLSIFLDTFLPNLSNSSVYAAKAALQ